jgi:hypothetical protein
MDAEGASLSRRRGGKHVKEGHQHGFGLFPGLQRVGAFGAEQEREEGERQWDEGGAEKAH